MVKFAHNKPLILEGKYLTGIIAPRTSTDNQPMPTEAFGIDFSNFGEETES